MQCGRSTKQQAATVVSDDLPIPATPVPPLASRLLKRDAKLLALALLKSKNNSVAEGES